ncbi:MAG: hypothetical protein K8L99_20970, partial [Anaerolineae bacterium]|nr:hypothetical protein [Anaerolineae bacterium]
GSLCIGFGGALIFLLLPQRVVFWLRVFAGVLYVISTPLWLALGMETALWIALVLAAVWLVSEERWLVAGFLAGIAVLVRPDAALPGGLLGLVVLARTVNQAYVKRRWWLPVVTFGAAAMVPIALFSLWSWATYGSLLPVTLGAKSAQAVLGITGLGPHVGTFAGLGLIVTSLLAQSAFYVIFGVFAVIGLSQRLNWQTVLIVLWGMLHLLAYAILQIAPYRWYYAPLLPGLILLVAYGLHWLYQRLSAPVVGAAVMILILAPIMSFAEINRYFENGGPMQVMLPIVDWQAYREVGEWLDEQTPPEATVGVAEVGQLGFYAQRWMTDYLGLLQPDVAEMLKRGDLYSWLAKYAPDYLVFQRFRGAPLVLYNYLIELDPWFNASYQPVAEFDDPRYSSGPVTIFERTTSLRELHEQDVHMDYGSLQLVGLATDGDAITQPGETIRVRLDWQVVGELPPNLHLAVKALDLPVFPSFDADYATENWSSTFSTWHTLVWPDTAETGEYPLHVAVGPTGGPYNGQNVGWFTVTR